MGRTEGEPKMSESKADLPSHAQSGRNRRGGRGLFGLGNIKGRVVILSRVRQIEGMGVTRGEVNRRRTGCPD